MEPGSGEASVPKKSRFCKYKQFATAIFDVTAHFNVGNLATRMIYDKLDIERGYYYH